MMVGKWSLARASLATTSRLKYLSCLKCSGEACPRQAPSRLHYTSCLKCSGEAFPRQSPQRAILDHCTYLNSIEAPPKISLVLHEETRDTTATMDTRDPRELNDKKPIGNAPSHLPA